MTPAELSGFLNLAIIGLRHIMETNKFSYQMSAAEVKAQYVSNSDPVWAFSQQMIMKTDLSSDYVTKDDLYEAYRDYADKNGHDKLSKIAFFRELGKHMTLKDQDISLEDDERRVSVVKGIKIRDQPVLTTFTRDTRDKSSHLVKFENESFQQGINNVVYPVGNNDTLEINSEDSQKKEDN